jgi:tetratricopeptide (TPR) repeat protein
MKRAFSLLFIILSLLTFKNVAFARSAVDECFRYYYLEYYNIAISYGKIAVKYYPNNPAAHYCLGLSYYAVREFKLALKHVKRAESLTSNKYDGIGYYHLSYVNYKGKLNLGDTYRRMKDYEKAEKYLLEGLEDVKKVRDKYWEATGYKYLGWLYRYKYKGKLNLGDTYRRMKDYEKAEKYLLEGLEDVKKVRDKYWEATGYKYLGWLYRDKMDKKTAQNYLTRYRDLDWLYKNKRGKNTAEDYLIRAYILYKSIGKEKEAKEVLSDIRELKKER